MGSSKNEKIKGTLTLVIENNVAVWHMDIKGQGKGGPKNYPKAKVTKGVGADFCFVITGKNTDKVTFKKINALWAKVDDGTGACPTEAGILTDQIHDVSGGGTKKLTFTDLNCGLPVDIVYQLNFEGAPPLDPVIRNTGGGGGGQNLNFATFALAGVAVLATLALVWLEVVGRPKSTEGSI